ncbi:MAG: type IV secretion system protein, partial [Comamonas sp.]
MDDAFGKGMDLAAQLWEQAGNRGLRETSMAIGEYINAVIIAVAILIIALPPGAMIVMAKAVLSIMLGIGPLFVMLLMWAPTKQFFDRWFAVVMTSLLQIALLAAVLSFAIKAFLAFVGPVDIDSEQNPLFTSLQLLVVASVMLYVLYTVNNYAAQLAGGMSTAAITFGGIARNAAGMASAPGQATEGVNNIVNPMSTRLEPRAARRPSDDSPAYRAPGHGSQRLGAQSCLPGWCHGAHGIGLGEAARRKSGAVNHVQPAGTRGPDEAYDTCHRLHHRQAGESRTGCRSGIRRSIREQWERRYRFCRLLMPSTWPPFRGPHCAMSFGQPRWAAWSTSTT